MCFHIYLEHLFRDAPKAESELAKEKFLKDEQRKLKEDPFEAKFKSLNRTETKQKKKPDEQLVLIYDKYYDEGTFGVLINFKIFF